MIDLDAYFARIGYHGPREPTLDVLRALHALHPAAIPFEAIDVLLGVGVDLAPAAVDAKLIGRRRGGGCFEQNGLFKRALVALGFEVENLIARVRWMQPAGAAPQPRGHMALRVTVDGERWLVDVGFGGCVMTAPIRFDSHDAQATPHEACRLTDLGREVRQEVQLPEGWTTTYDLSKEVQAEVDYEPANWFAATHPNSLFRATLIVARTTPQARYALLNNRLTIRWHGLEPERHVFGVEDLAHALESCFGLPVEDAWRPVLERAVAAGG